MNARETAAEALRKCDWWLDAVPDEYAWREVDVILSALTEAGYTVAKLEGMGALIETGEIPTHVYSDYPEDLDLGEPLYRIVSGASEQGNKET